MKKLEEISLPETKLKIIILVKFTKNIFIGLLERLKNYSC